MEERITMGGGGILTLRQDGPRVRMEARRPSDGKGLYKVWLRGNQGGKLLLGTLVPDNGQLVLRRTLSVSALEQAGCWPQFRVEALLSFPFSPTQTKKWYCEPHPNQLVSDPVLQRQLTCSMLCQKDQDGFSLATPFRPDQPVALSALFCLARLECWDGRPHLVWTFDQDGHPKIPCGSNKPE